MVSSLILSLMSPLSLASSAEDSRLTGTLFGASPSYAAGCEYDKAFDGNTDTYYDYLNPDNGYVGLDLGADAHKRLTRVRFYPRQGFDYRMPGGKIQGSNNGQDYADLYVISSVSGGWNEITLNDAQPYRYIRYLAPAGAYGNIAELELYGEDVPQTVVELEGAAFGATPAYSQDTGFDKAFDGSTSTYYDFASANGAYTGIDTGAGNAYTITKIRFFPRGGSGYFVDRMLGGKFQGSNTSGTDGYQDIYTITSVQNEWNEVNIQNAGSYRYFRYVGADGSYGNVAEIEFYGYSSGSGSAELQPTGSSGVWNMTFQDEFDESSLDTTKWNTQWGPPGAGWNECWSTERMRPYDVEVADGICQIKTQVNQNIIDGLTGKKEIESGVITTWGHFEQKYGFFEARIKAAQGPGILNAFWMSYTQNWPPELDIMEILGGYDWELKNAYMTQIWASDGKDQRIWQSPTNLTESYHVYGLEWTPSEVIWYIDGIERARQTTKVQDVPLYLELNIHNGNDWSGYPDYDDPSTRTMDVDYVRAWSR